MILLTVEIFYTLFHYIYIYIYMAGEETRRKLHKNVESSIEQVLATTPHETPTIRTLAPHHENYTSKMNQTLLEKQGRAHKWCTPMDTGHRTQDVTLKTCWRRWMIGRSGERGSGISVLAARHDDYDIYIWTLTKRLEKKLDGNYTRMLRAILNKSWRQHPTRHQLYGHSCRN